MCKNISKLFIILLLLCSFLMPLCTYAIDYTDMEIKQNADGSISIKKVDSIQGEQGMNANQTELEEEMNEKYQKYLIVLDFIMAIAAVTMIAIFIKHTIKFASLGGEHWIIRRNSMIGMLWSAIATVLLGGATFIVAITYNLFQF